MRNVPPSVRAALKRRGADDILNQEGEYADFKPQIDRIIHGNEDMSGYIGDAESFEDYDDDATPQEQKANDRIEELGDKYKIYQYPKDLSKKDIDTAKKYGLEYLGVVGEEGFQPGDHAIKGKYSDLDRFNKEYLGYDFHPDYLYDEDDFNTDVLKKEDAEKKPIHIQSLENQVSRNPSYKAIADSISDKQDVNEAYFYALKDAFEKNNYEPSDKDISSELSDRYWDLADSFRDRYGMSDGEWDRSGWARFEDEYGTEEDFINKGIEAYNKHFDELGSPDDEKSQSNWYDNLDDSDEYAKHYKDAAMKVNPERAALIAAAMDEYVAEKPQRGFITDEQMKRYGERLGLPQMSDRDLRLMWDDIHNVAGYRGFGTPYDKGGRELEDAQSAFAEVVNQEARNRKAKGNYFPYNDEDIEKGKDDIRDILRRLDGHDLDDARGYLTGDELDEIERIADEYHLTADDLAKISHHLDPNRMGYGMKGWQEPLDNKEADFPTGKRKLRDFAQIILKTPEIRDLGAEMISWKYGLSESEAEKYLSDIEKKFPAEFKKGK